MDHRLRVRQRFSGFYDLPVREDAAANDIDGANFDADGYATSFLRTKPLPELVSRSLELSSEIKELDSDMQMLVYENYNKFISATETIQQMKAKVDGMDGVMKNLSDSVKEITDSSNHVNANLAERRVRIQKLNGVRRLLKKLSFIFELPTRLTRAVELDACAEAARYWRTSLPVLKAYKHVPAFQAVEVESAEILERLRDKLRQRLHAPDTSPQDLHEAAALLLQLDEGERGPLREQYMAVRKERLMGSLRERVPRESEVKLGEKTGVLSRSFLDEVKRMVLSYQELFLSAAPLAADQEGGAAGGEGGAEGADGSEELTELVRALVERYVVTLESEVTRPSVEEDSSGVVDQLESWYDAVRSIDAILPDANVGEGMDAVVQFCCERRVTASFQKLAASLSKAVAAIAKVVGGRSTKPEAVAEAVQQNATTFLGELEVGLQRLAALILSETHLMARFRAALAADVHREVLSLMEGPAQRAVDSVEAHVRDSAGFALALSSFWIKLKDAGPEVIASALDAKTAGAVADSHLLAATTEAYGRRVEATVMSLLIGYVENKAEGVRRKVWAVVGAGGEEAGGEAGADKIVEEIRKVSVEVKEVLGEGEGGGRRAEGEGEGHTVVLEAAMAAVGPDATSVSRATTVLALHTMIELLRQQTLSDKAMHEVGAAVHGLRSGLGEAAEHGMVAALLDEALATAKDRHLSR